MKEIIEALEQSNRCMKVYAYADKPMQKSIEKNEKIIKAMMSEAALQTSSDMVMVPKDDIQAILFDCQSVEKDGFEDLIRKISEACVSMLSASQTDKAGSDE